MQLFARIILILYILGMIPYFFWGLQGLATRKKARNPVVDLVGQGIAVLFVSFTWPILMGKTIYAIRRASKNIEVK